MKVSSKQCCLFCKADLLSATVNNVGEEEEVTIKKESEVLIVTRDHEDFGLEDHLKSIFILRRLLDFSAEKCANYLGKTNGEEASLACHPGDWVSLCGKCDGVVEECFQIYREVLRWKRRLEKKKEGVKTGIERAYGRKWNEVAVNLETFLDGSFHIPSPPKIQQTEETVCTFRKQRGRRSCKSVKPASKQLECGVTNSSDFNLNSPISPKSPDVSPSPEVMNYSSDPEAEDSHSDPIWNRTPDADNLKSNVSQGEGKMKRKRKSRCSNSNNEDDNGIKLEKRRMVGRKKKARKVPKFTNTSTADIPTKHFKCSECIASYELEQNLTKHKRVHQLPPDTIFSCPKCGWAYQKTLSQRHRELCFGLRTRIQCQLCPAFYSFQKAFEKHCDLHKTGNGEACIHCGWILSKEDRNLHELTHYREDIDPTKIFQIASKTPEVAKEKKKRKSAEEEIPYYCDHCHLIYPGKCQLIRHFICAHKKHKPLLECEICLSRTFESKQLLQMHKESVHRISSAQQEDIEESSSSFACQHCSVEPFSTKMKLDYHVSRWHWKTQLACPICKTKHKDYNTLKMHIETHDPDFTTICELCSKTIRKGSIKMHMQLFHYKELGLEAIRCEECQAVFHSKSKLKNHMDFQHLKNVSSCCPSCPKKFKRKLDLDRHIQSHANPKKLVYKKGPFFCKICQAKFNVRQGLYYHMKRLHSDKYMYRCEKCGKGYCFENTLLDHQKSCKKGEKNGNSVDIDEPNTEQL